MNTAETDRDERYPLYARRCHPAIEVLSAEKIYSNGTRRCCPST